MLAAGGCSSPARSMQPAETIAVNDRLRLTIRTVNLVGEIEPWETVAVSRVDRDGNLDVPLLGPVPATGRTRAEVSEQVRQALKANSEVEDMPVTIDLVEKSPNVSITSGRVCAGDHLLFQIEDLEALGKLTTMVLTVDSTGCIAPPMIKQVKVVNLSEYQAEQACDKAYRDGQIINNSQIHIERISAKEATDLQRTSADHSGGTVLH